MSNEPPVTTFLTSGYVTDPKDAEIARLRAENKQLKRETEFFQKQSKTHREQHHQERDNALMLYKALAKSAPDALKDVVSQLWPNTLEADKFMSEASREREKRQRAEWKHAEIMRAVLDDRGVSELTIGKFYIYATVDGGADVLEGK